MRSCIGCGRVTGLFLHQGRLWCRHCLPSHSLPPVDRYAWLLWRLEADRSERREAREQRRKPEG